MSRSTSPNNDEATAAVAAELSRPPQLPRSLSWKAIARKQTSVSRSPASPRNNLGDSSHPDLNNRLEQEEVEAVAALPPSTHSRTTAALVVNAPIQAASAPSGSILKPYESSNSDTRSSAPTGPSPLVDVCFVAAPAADKVASPPSFSVGEPVASPPSYSVGAFAGAAGAAGVPAPIDVNADPAASAAKKKLESRLRKHLSSSSDQKEQPRNEPRSPQISSLKKTSLKATSSAASSSSVAHSTTSSHAEANVIAEKIAAIDKDAIPLMPVVRLLGLICGVLSIIQIGVGSAAYSWLKDSNNGSFYAGLVSFLSSVVAFRTGNVFGLALSSFFAGVGVLVSAVGSVIDFTAVNTFGSYNTCAPLSSTNLLTCVCSGTVGQDDVVQKYALRVTAEAGAIPSCGALQTSYVAVLRASGALSITLLLLCVAVYITVIVALCRYSFERQLAFLDQNEAANKNSSSHNNGAGSLKSVITVDDAAGVAGAAITLATATTSAPVVADPGQQNANSVVLAISPPQA